MMAEGGRILRVRLAARHQRVPRRPFPKSIAESAGGVSDAIPFFGGATALSVRGVVPATSEHPEGHTRPEPPLAFMDNPAHAC